MLQEIGLLGCKPKGTPIDQSPPFWDEASDSFDDASRYRRLIGKLIFPFPFFISFFYAD